MLMVATITKFLPLRSSLSLSPRSAIWGSCPADRDKPFPAKAYQGRTSCKYGTLLQVPKVVSLGPSQIMIEWSDGHSSVHGNRALREACPCALCKGEPPAIGSSKFIPLMPAAPPDVHALKSVMVGRYAISFAWSDGHASGIYPYEYILATCECEACVANKSAPRLR